jgi:membrane protein DedA with SNARE-associated domain
MAGSLEQAVAALVAHGQWWAMPVLAGAAAVEYLFPPFPGDTVTLAGAVLARLGDWSIPLVFTTLLAGNLAGAMADYLVGRLLGPKRLLKMKRFAGQAAALNKVLTGFRRYGPALLVVNRFLPGIRALFFVAAGMAGLKPLPVFLYAGLSAALWTALLLGAGFLVGDNLPLLETLFARYFQVVWVVIIVGAAILLWRWSRR